MSHLIALEIGATEARIATASARGDRLMVEQGLVVPLPTGEAATPEARAAAVVAALKEHGITRGEALALLGRCDVELRQLVMPPAPESELPAMVRNLAFREFNEAEENWLLDFAPLDAAADSPRTVIAASVDPARVAALEGIVQEAGMKLRRALLRPLASAYLVSRALPAGSDELCLLVDVLGDEADLTVLRGRQVVFLRTARAGADALSSAEAAPVLSGEIRRTIAAAQSQLPGQRIARLVFMGDRETQRALAQQLGESLSLASEVFDPLQGIAVGREWDRAPPARPERFAPLLGALAAELQGAPQAIDFLNPRRPPEAPSRRNYYVFGGVAAVLLALGYFAYGAWERQELTTENARLASQVKQDTALAKKLKDVENGMAEIDKWQHREIVWLDELADLSSRLPAAHEIAVTQVTLAQGPQQGEVRFDALATSAEAIDELQKKLSDDRHRFIEKSRSENSATPPYQLQFSAIVTIEPPPAPPSASNPADAARSKEATKSGVLRSAPAKDAPAKEPPGKTPAPGADASKAATPQSSNDAAAPAKAASRKTRHSKSAARASEKPAG